jgi:hypothetical protein
VLLVLLLKVVNTPVWSWLIQRELYPPAGYPDENAHRWVSTETISPAKRLADIAAEDQRFADHRGFDFKAIKRALDHNLDGGNVRGASTLTQQTAKNLFLWSGRSWVRKGTAPPTGWRWRQVRSPAGLRILRRPHRPHRLQGAGQAATLRLRPREDRAAPKDRHLRQAPAHANAGPQARAPHRPAALHCDAHSADRRLSKPLLILALA